MRSTLLDFGIKVLKRTSMLASYEAGGVEGVWLTLIEVDDIWDGRRVTVGNGA